MPENVVIFIGNIFPALKTNGFSVIIKIKYKSCDKYFGKLYQEISYVAYDSFFIPEDNISPANEYRNNWTINSSEAKIGFMPPISPYI